MVWQKVKLPLQHSAADYSRFNPLQYRQLKHLAKRLVGLPVLHLNATSQGGGVAEMLQSQIPFERSLGLDSQWCVIDGVPATFFTITKKIHNLLQGQTGQLSQRQQQLYLQVNRQLGNALQPLLAKWRRGIVVVHDPQPLTIIEAIPKRFRAILRLHIDLSTPQKQLLTWFKPYIREYDQVIVSHEKYLPKKYVPNSTVIIPAIDPLALKNGIVPQARARHIMAQLGIDPTQPIVTQVSRFDRWKDPIGVIKAFRAAQRIYPKLQLVLAGIMLAHDDPEASTMLRQVQRFVKQDQSIHLFYNSKQIGHISNDLFINALYTVSTVVIQNSNREGFGLTMTEAMWKQRAVIAHASQGASMQIESKHNGMIVHNQVELNRVLIELLDQPKRCSELGKAAHDHVRTHFLLPRLVWQHLILYRQLVS